MAAVVLKAPERLAFDCEVLPAGDAPALKLELQGKYRKRSELEAFVTWSNGEGVTDVDIVADELLAWNVQLEDGTPVPCDRAGIEQLLDIHPNAATAINDAYLRTLVEARRKN